MSKSEKKTACMDCEHHFCISWWDSGPLNDHWCDHGPEGWDPITATDRRCAVRCHKKNMWGRCPDFEVKHD